MKKNILFFLTILCSVSYAQNQDFEYSTAYELKKRLNFKQVNDRYEIENDTIFYSFPGFLVNSNIDTTSISNIKYVILTYPNFKSINSTVQNGITITSSTNLVRKSIAGTKDKILAIPYEEFMRVERDTLYDTSWKKKRNYKVSTGLLTIPFKLRPEQGEKNFTMTTDVTIGPYFGITKRISKRNPYYLTLPATLGLSFININDNTTSVVQSDPNIGIVPGYTWSTGIILQLNKFDIGFVLGQDFASDVGDDWIYQGKTWYSFAIGYSFSKTEK